MDAYKTWYSRNDPTAAPLGDDVKRFERAPTLDPKRFLGYQLDKKGVPTFLYRIGETSWEERLVPDSEGGFVRTLTKGNAEPEVTTIRW